MDDCRSGGQYTFRLLWPRNEPGHLANIWSQSSSPLQGRGVERYRAISVHYSVRVPHPTLGRTASTDRALA